MVRVQLGLSVPLCMVKLLGSRVLVEFSFGDWKFKIRGPAWLCEGHVPGCRLLTVSSHGERAIYIFECGIYLTLILLYDTLK